MGVESEFLGNVSDMTSINTEYANSTVMPSEIFSPLSGGRMKTSRSMSDINTTGKRMLTTLYRDFLSIKMENYKANIRLTNRLFSLQLSD